MPRLEKLLLSKCRLRHVPPGLASNATSLKILCLQYVKQLSYIESFPSVVELKVLGCPDLERITNLPNLQKLTIINCPMLKVLERIASLERLVLEDYTMEKLPEYMRDIKPRHLQLLCRLWLLSAVAAGQSSTEWDKFSQVEHVKAYARDGDNQRKWYVLYTGGDNYKLDSNISSSTIFEETLSSCMVDPQGFESVYKMRRSTFSYICSLVRVPFFDSMMAREHTFVDGRVLSLQDGVAVALRMLNSGETSVTLGSSVGVNESTVSLVTTVFVEAMWKKAWHHFSWSGSDKMDKIKRKFDKIHSLPNCCGVVHIAHFTFGSQNCDHEENDGRLMQAVVDPDMRFTNIWLGSSGSMNQSSLLHDSRLFKSCEEGTWLNGSKLNLSDGWQVGEYIIGDAGYPLFPWLLTPYRLEDMELTQDFAPYQAEFNRRHSAASTITHAALARLKDTWKILDGAMWRSVSSCPLPGIIYTCCMLHNIVIYMEEEGEGIPNDQGENYIDEVRQLADEDAGRVRDRLSQHLIKSGETLSSSMVDAQGFDSLYKMRRSTFSYVCSLVRIPFFEDMMARDHTFIDGRLLSLQDRVAVALRMLNSGGSPVTIGSSLGVEESTVSLVTQVFVEAMWKRAIHHCSWPGSTKMEKIKRNFDKMHGLPNCCGVVHTDHITFGSQNLDHEGNDVVPMQVVIDSDMRLTEVWLDDDLLECIVKYAWLNGRKLKLSDGSEVGEYIIGDAGHPLRPWLLTPYQLENGLPLSDSKVEFNRRHSAATAVARKALARLKDTWKCLQGEGWHPNNQAIGACCMLHNIVMDLEEDEGASMPSGHEGIYVEKVDLWKLADEDAVMVRDALSQHLIRSGVHTMAAEEEQAEVAAVASGSGNGNKEQDACQRQKADQGKEKMHDS